MLLSSNNSFILTYVLIVCLLHLQFSAAEDENSNKSKWPTGKIIGIALGSFAIVVIVICALLFCYCKCRKCLCCCCCCDKDNDRSIRSYSNRDDYRHYGGSKEIHAAAYPEVTHPVLPVTEAEQQLHNQALSQPQPLAPQAYHGALENILNQTPVTHERQALELQPKPLPVEEKKSKKNKKRRNSDSSSYITRQDGTIMSPELLAQRYPQATSDEILPSPRESVEPALYESALRVPQNNVFPVKYDNSYLRQVNNGPVIVADMPKINENNRQFLPHLNIAFAPSKNFYAKGNNYYSSQYSYNHETNNHFSSGSNYSRRMGVLPGAQPLPGMANSTEYRNAYDRKLPRHA